MVGASKILTVSYGTFSCTLEGFDDPFSTMKAIAEYFRDLAAEDRFFGAEPPTPDAEMLSRIAEREAQRRVEASVGTKGIVLRQTAPAAPAAVAVSQTEPRPMPAPAADGAPKPAVTAAEESVAAKLMRIRAAVAASRATPIATAFPASPAAAISEEPAQDDTEEAEPADMAAPEPAESATTAFDAANIAIDLEERPSEPAGDAVAEPAMSAPEAVAGPASTEVSEASDLEPEAAGATSADDSATDEGLAAPAASDEDDIARGRAALAAAQPVIDAEEDDESATPLDDDDALRAVLAASGGSSQAHAEPEDEIRDALLGAVTEPSEANGREAPTEASDEVAPDALAEPAEEAVAAPNPEAMHGEDAPRARVVKVSRRKSAAADEPAPAAETSPEAEAPASPEEPADAVVASIEAVIGKTGLTADDEAELLAQLSAVQDAADRRDGPEGRAILEGAADEGEAAVDRLMEEANTKLEGAENRRRFSAIAHLKAAVAATVADRKLKSKDAAPPAAPDEGMDLYRDDLSKAVRPRRPASESAASTRRPTVETRPAPLVLVSELRVDRPPVDAMREAAVVRPRRVSAGNLALSDDDEPSAIEDLAPLPPEEARSFAEFAERLGAVDLADLLEAAAVYTATVEGKPHFTRPHILRKVASASEEGDFSREDGMRSFGMLLRQGKFQKVERGHFAVADTSRYMTEARRAAH